MQFTSARYSDEKFWQNHELLIKNFKNLYSRRYRELSLELLSKNSVKFFWEKSLIEVSFESSNLMRVSVCVEKDGRGIGGASRFVFQSFTKKRWLTNFFAQLEAGLQEIFVDIPPYEMNEVELTEERDYLGRIFALEEQRIDYYSALARELKRKFKLSIEYEDVVIKYKLGLVGCTYSIFYREEKAESARGYSRLGWGRKAQMGGLPFIFARHEVEYGQRG